MLGGLAADQRATGDPATLGNPRDDGRNPLGNDLSAGNVVRQKERFTAADDDVVNHHRDEIEAYRVVPVEHPCDGDLGSDAVGRRREHWRR